MSKETSFRPKGIYPTDIAEIDPNIESISLNEGLSRFYEVADIIYFREKFFMLTAVDRSNDKLYLKDVTDQVKVG